MDKTNTSKKAAGQAYEVPPAGSLGLLALGYRGWVAWREALKKHIEEENSKAENGKKNS